MPGWTYLFHGIGCCLTAPDGEVIDVDQRDDAAAVIDPYFFAWRVRSVRERRFPESRLWRWMHSQEMVVAALADLLAAGAIRPFEGEHLFRLAPALEGRAHALDACDFETQTTRDLWCAGLGDSDREATIRAHRVWIHGVATDSARAYLALDAARAFLPPQELEEVCMRHLRPPAGPNMGKALGLLREIGATRALPAALSLLDILSPTQDPPFPAYEAFSYVLDAGAITAHVLERFTRFATVEVVKGFRGHPFAAKYALLAFWHAPALAMPLVRRALRSNTPICVNEMAGLLAAIGHPWCVRELSSALRENNSSVIAAALRQCPSRVAAKFAERTYAAPVHDDAKIGFSWDEVQHARADATVREAMNAAHENATLLRARFPPTWEG